MDIDHLRSWIGREQSDAEVLTPMLVRQFNATFDRKGSTEEGDIAPLLIHFCLTQPVSPESELGPDGHPARGGFLPPVPLPRRMWAGGAFAFHGDIRIGERVERRSTIRDVVLKQGRSGPLCFVTVEHEITSGGKPALTERQDIVYRDAPAGEQTMPEGEAAPQGRHTRRITPTATLLFRYSAMTFNGHRIHYDIPYATEIEGYPGLIVHGPMQATLLCQTAADLRGTRPERFSFRSLSPIFDTADFTVNADDKAGAMRLWIARVGGPLAMEALAEW
ncbi:MaoC family dehydratase N-terminal domain-containing protein [Marivita sp. GX14005]|uniref:FAS1-like dehydratase domain-containing protein n=1 Tax=Marivita sp. GX14005 TaxID=2942276 RepID=UPI0020185AA1|nr:MaoC family dehydratase N-terminal domain-containing protein [Marivita sp. GX14005]MCL3882181.1 MaoC family dehydratase N-terminal domain-containing protein [Marivita sp. GX14005]